MPRTSHPEKQALVNNHKVKGLIDSLVEESKGSITINDDNLIQTLDDLVSRLVEEQSRKNLCNGWLILHIFNAALFVPANLLYFELGKKGAKVMQDWSLLPSINGMDAVAGGVSLFINWVLCVYYAYDTIEKLKQSRQIHAVGTNRSWCAIGPTVAKKYVPILCLTIISSIMLYNITESGVDGYDILKKHCVKWLTPAVPFFTAYATSTQNFFGAAGIYKYVLHTDWSPTCEKVKDLLKFTFSIRGFIQVMNAIANVCFIYAGFPDPENRNFWRTSGTIISEIIFQALTGMSIDQTYQDIKSIDKCSLMLILLMPVAAGWISANTSFSLLNDNHLIKKEEQAQSWFFIIPTLIATIIFNIGPFISFINYKNSSQEKRETRLKEELAAEALEVHRSNLLTRTAARNTHNGGSINSSRVHPGDLP